MPTYEYRCPEGHDFERFFRSISAAESTVACPVCGKIAERRMSSGAGLLFKGSGFYLTDYGKNAHRSSGDAKPSGDNAPTGDKSGGEKSGGEKPGGEKSGAEQSGGEKSTSESSSTAKSE